MSSSRPFYPLCRAPVSGTATRTPVGSAGDVVVDELDDGVHLQIIEVEPPDGPPQSPAPCKVTASGLAISHG
jgi:hypothetical protein